MRAASLLCCHALQSPRHTTDGFPRAAAWCRLSLDTLFESDWINSAEKFCPVYLVLEQLPPRGEAPPDSGMRRRKVRRGLHAAPLTRACLRCVTRCHPAFPHPASLCVSAAAAAAMLPPPAPLPPALQVTIFHYDGAARPTTYGVDVAAVATVRDIMAAAAPLVGLDPAREQFLAADMSHNGFQWTRLPPEHKVQCSGAAAEPAHAAAPPLTCPPAESCLQVTDSSARHAKLGLWRVPNPPDKDKKSAANYAGKAARACCTPPCQGPLCESLQQGMVPSASLPRSPQS